MISERTKAERAKYTYTKATKARKLRAEAAELDQRALKLTHMMATMDGERVRLFVEAESKRMQADGLEG